MFETQHQNWGDYFEVSQRPVNYNQNLWRVDDSELHKPGERFISGSSPYLDSIVEKSIAGPLESAPIPKGLLTYVTDAVKAFGVVSSKYSSVEEVLFRVLRWLDFEEIYYLIFGAAVQQNCNQLKFTYRLKKDGTVLPPNRLECFNIVRSFDFPQYKACCEFMDHPMIKAAMAGQVVLHQSKRTPITLDDIFDKLSEILYGDYGGLLSETEQWLYTFYTSLEVNRVMDDEEILNLDSSRNQDSMFWIASTLAALMWFKSPYAIRYLSEYHPVYMKLLRWDDRQKRMVVIPESGGEVVVDGWDVYTREHLIVEESNPPGTCECCKTTLHCTKYVNAQALFHPTCSCGQPVPVEDTDFHGHDWKGTCTSYLSIHPPFNAFVCQRCMYMAINKLEPSVAKCQRTICPATQCPHHIGSRAYMNELTKRRTMLLTSRTLQ